MVPCSLINGTTVFWDMVLCRLVNGTIVFSDVVPSSLVNGTTLFWDMVLCSLVKVPLYSSKWCRVVFLDVSIVSLSPASIVLNLTCPEDGNVTFARNVCTCVPNYAASTAED